MTAEEAFFHQRRINERHLENDHAAVGRPSNQMQFDRCHANQHLIGCDNRHQPGSRHQQNGLQQKIFRQDAEDLSQHQQQQQQHPFRRIRTNFSTWQLDVLERAFHAGHYPDSAISATLALQLQLPESRIQVC